MRMLLVSVMTLGFLTIYGEAWAEYDTYPPPSPPPILTVTKNAVAGDVVLSWNSTTSPYTITRSTFARIQDTTPAPLAQALVGGPYSDPVLGNGSTYYYSVDDAFAGPVVLSTSSTLLVEGETITVTGYGFDPNLGNNILLIGGVEATAVTATENEITFMVPVGSMTGLFSISNTNGSSVPRYRAVTRNKANPIPTITSIAVDSAGNVFAATQGAPSTTSDRIWRVPTAMAPVQVGNLNECYGLGVDTGNSPNRVFFGNGLTDVNNYGLIRYTTSAGGQTQWNFAGCQTSLLPAYVRATAIYPDFGGPGIPGVFAADARNGRVYRVNAGATGCGSVIIASGFTFTDPAGMTVDMNPTSPYYQHLFFGHSLGIEIYTAAGVFVKSLPNTLFNNRPPGQMTFIPGTRKGLVVVVPLDNAIYAVDPQLEKSRRIEYRRDDGTLIVPRAVALREDVPGMKYDIYLADTSFVYNARLNEAVYLDIQINNDSGFTEQDVDKQVKKAKDVWAQAGIDIVVRGGAYGYFDQAYTNCDPSDSGKVQKSIWPGATGCSYASYVRTVDEQGVLVHGSSKDLLVYFVKELTGNCPNPDNTSGKTYTDDVAADITGDSQEMTDSGMIFSRRRMLNPGDPAPDVVLAHEIGHALLFCPDIEPADPTVGPEHSDPLTKLPLQAPKLMASHAIRGNVVLTPEQIQNVQQKKTIFVVTP